MNWPSTHKNLLFSQSSPNIYVVQKRRHITSATSDQHGRFHLISHVRILGKLIAQWDNSAMDLDPFLCALSDSSSSIAARVKDLEDSNSISFQSKLELTDPILNWHWLIESNGFHFWRGWNFAPRLWSSSFTTFSTLERNRTSASNGSWSISRSREYIIEEVPEDLGWFPFFQIASIRQC